MGLVKCQYCTGGIQTKLAAFNIELKKKIVEGFERTIFWSFFPQ